MAEARVERRLAAILAADVAGSSRLMGTDEVELVDPAIAAHRGRIVKTTGDGMLVEFASAVDAARCAVSVQRALAEQNAKAPEVNRLEYRIGIHVGDIMVDENDIFGNGVNIAVLTPAALYWDYFSSVAHFRIVLRDSLLIYARRGRPFAALPLVRRLRCVGFAVAGAGLLNAFFACVLCDVQVAPRPV